MISKDSLQPEWINQVAAQNRKADKILIEKVIRALLLLEGLVESGLPFILKGGTAVMMLQQRPKRFSIDLDIIVTEKADFEVCVYGFYGFCLHIDKDHDKTEPQFLRISRP